MKKQDSIVIRGLNQNNLKHVSLTYLKTKLLYSREYPALENPALYLIQLLQRVNAR